jgi:RNA polymerase sigma-70 factor, ECF subfamily
MTWSGYHAVLLRRESVPGQTADFVAEYAVCLAAPTAVTILDESPVSRVASVSKAPLRLVAPTAREGVDAPDDEELILAVQRGDRQVASALYDRLIRVVDHTVYRVFGRREVDHDDLVQMVFEQIIVTLSRRSYARACNLRTWASSIASHVAFNALRSRRRERKVMDRDAPPDSETYASRADAEREAAVRSDLRLVRATLVDMKPQYAETVFLHDVLGHELAEIALMMRVSVAAAQSRLVRGRKDLHKRLAMASASVQGASR